MTTRRLLSQPSSVLLLLRRLCTAAATATEAAAAEEEATVGSGSLLSSSFQKEEKKRTKRPRVAMKNLLGRISELGSTRGRVDEVLDYFVREGNVVRKDDLFNCVRNIRKVRRYQHCYEIMQWMEKKKYNYSARDHAVFLDIVAKFKGVSEAEKYFNALSSEVKDQFTYGALLNCYCKDLVVDKAVPLFEEMDKLNVLSPLAFNDLMGMYLRLDQPEKVPSLIKDMENRNLPAKNFSKILLMQAYDRMNDTKSAERIFEEIKAKGENQNWIVYSNVAHMYIRAGLSEKAELALKQLEDAVKSKKRERAAYLYLISFYATTGDHAGVLRVWDLLKSSYPECHNSSYLCLLQAISKLEKLDDLEKFFQEWSLSCQDYDPKLANHVIRTYLNHDLVDKAEQVLESGSSRAKSPLFKGHEAFMSYYLEKGYIGSALGCWEKAIADVKNDLRWQPKWEFIYSFFGHFLKERDAFGAEAFCSMLKKADCLDGKAYLALLQVYADSGKTNLEMKRRMEEDGIEISSEHEDLLEKVSRT